MTARAVAPIELPPSPQIAGCGQSREISNAPRQRGARVEQRSVIRRAALIIGTLAVGARVRLTFLARQSPVAAESFEIRDDITRGLLWTRRRAFKQPRERRHHRIRHHRARFIEMGEFPVIGTDAILAGQIGTDSPGAPKLRVIENRFPSQSGGAEAFHVAIEITDLLGMAVGASILPVDQAAALLACSQGEWMLRPRVSDLPFEHAARPYGEQQDRHGKEPHAADAGSQIRHSQEALHERYAPANPGVTSRTGSSPMDFSIAFRPPPRGPASSPPSSARKPAVTGTKVNARINQYGFAARTD